MSAHFLRALALALSLCAGLASAASPSIETLVFVRHGEKPADVDNGQLACQGQNRALALPGVLIPKFGIPSYAFAVKPNRNQDSNGIDYWYLRALATIEPTAVAAGITVDAKYKKSDIDKLESELAKSRYQNATVFVAWEHNELAKLAANLVKNNGGDKSIVPAWSDDDYDSIFVVTLTRNGGQTTVAFAHDSEGLSGYLPLLCSTPQNATVPSVPGG